MKRNTRPQDSFCWDCKNARAHLCAWIGRWEKIWDEADKQERANNIKYYKGKKPTYTVYIVKRCKYFDPEGGKKENCGNDNSECYIRNSEEARRCLNILKK